MLFKIHHYRSLCSEEAMIVEVAKLEKEDKNVCWTWLFLSIVVVVFPLIL